MHARTLIGSGSESLALRHPMWLERRAFPQRSGILVQLEAGLLEVPEDGRDTYGHSLVVDPWGEVILEMGGEPGLAFTEVDLGRIAEVRARIPVHQHRRPIPPVAN